MNVSGVNISGINVSGVKIRGYEYKWCEYKWCVRNCDANVNVMNVSDRNGYYFKC